MVKVRNFLVQADGAKVLISEFTSPKNSVKGQTMDLPVQDVEEVFGVDGRGTEDGRSATFGAVQQRLG